MAWAVPSAVDFSDSRNTGRASLVDWPAREAGPEPSERRWMTTSASEVQPQTSPHKSLPSIQSSNQSASDGLWGWIMESISAFGSLSPIPMK